MSRETPGWGWLSKLVNLGQLVQWGYEFASWLADQALAQYVLAGAGAVLAGTGAALAQLNWGWIGFCALAGALLVLFLVLKLGELTRRRTAPEHAVSPSPTPGFPTDPNFFFFSPASEESPRGLQALMGPKIPDTRECGAQDMVPDLDPEGVMRRLESAQTDLVRKTIAGEYVGRCFTWDGRVARYSGASATQATITGYGSRLTGLPVLSFEMAPSRVAGLPTIIEGQHVTLVGRVSDIVPDLGITLSGCRLEGPPRNPPA